MNALNILLLIIAARVGIKSIKKYITRPHKLKMKLIKYSNTDMVKIIDLPDELYTIDEKSIENNEIYKKTYEEFGKKIVEVVNREDLVNFYRNFATIKEKKLPSWYLVLHFILKGQLVGGGYDTEDNTIDFETTSISKMLNSVVHELLHAASTYFDKEHNVIYCGFSQMYPDKEHPRKSETFGVGITEGCTQYFANKYFFNIDNYMTARTVYRDEQDAAIALEKIVGEERFKSLYFRADLNGLVKILEKYASKEDIYRFINYTDVLCYNARDKDLNFDELNKTKEFIKLFLIKAYNNAIAMNDITRDETFDTPYRIRNK